MPNMGYHWSPCPGKKSILPIVVIGIIAFGWISSNGSQVSSSMTELLIWIAAVFGSAIVLSIVGGTIFMVRGMRMYRSAHVTCQCSHCISMSQNATVDKPQTAGEIAAAPVIDISEEYIRNAINKKVR